jgi:hypothetical protein
MRSAVNAERQIKKDENKVRDSERKRRAKSDAALDAERAKIESADRERALKAEQKAARDARYAARKSRSKPR